MKESYNTSHTHSEWRYDHHSFDSSHGRNESYKTPEYDTPATELTSHPVLEKVVCNLENAIPDWDAVGHTFEADNRKDCACVDNVTGALTEHVARHLFNDLLVEHAEEDGDTFIHTNPMPDTVSQVGKYVFVTDASTGNYMVFDPLTQQIHTELDGIYAIEDLGQKRNGKTKVMILEVKSAMKRARNTRDVKRYIAKKIQPFKLLFKDCEFTFVLAVCKQNSFSRNQVRFISALKRLGGIVATLPVTRDEVASYAQSYI